MVASERLPPYERTECARDVSRNQKPYGGF
jgi:hypothetical protein